MTVTIISYTLYLATARALALLSLVPVHRVVHVSTCTETKRDSGKTDHSTFKVYVLRLVLSTRLVGVSLELLSGITVSALEKFHLSCGCVLPEVRRYSEEHSITHPTSSAVLKN